MKVSIIVGLPVWVREAQQLKDWFDNGPSWTTRQLNRNSKPFSTSARFIYWPVLLLWTALHAWLCRTNQMGYIIQQGLPGIYGNVSQPCPQAMPSDSVYCHKSLSLCYNYYIIANAAPYCILCCWFGDFYVWAIFRMVQTAKKLENWKICMETLLVVSYVIIASWLLNVREIFVCQILI